MGKRVMHGVLLAALLAGGLPAGAADGVDDESGFVLNESGNSAAPRPSEEALIFTGQDEAPLTPSGDGFRDGVESVVSGAQAFSSWLGPETWAILIGGFALVGFAVRRSERVLRFEPRRDPVTDRTDHPEDRSAGSAPDASTPPHSGSDRAPSAPQAPTE